MSPKPRGMSCDDRRPYQLSNVAFSSAPSFTFATVRHLSHVHPTTLRQSLKPLKPPKKAKHRRTLRLRTYLYFSFKAESYPNQKQKKAKETQKTTSSYSTQQGLQEQVQETIPFFFF